MNLIALSIRRPVFAWILMSAMIIFGAICFNRLGVSQMPDIDFPVLNISVNYEGASPEVIESELIDPIERSLLSIEGIREMKSSVRQGSGSVQLDFDIERNVDVALQEVQSALSEVRYPLGIDPPVVRKRNPEDAPIMFLGISSKRPLRETINWTESYLLDQFRFLPGIGEVDVGGFSERNLRVWPDPEKLRRLDLTVADLLGALESQHLETSAGQFSNGRQEYRVRWLGEAGSPEELGNIEILRRGGSVIQDRVFRIKDVASVEDGLSDIRRVARINGEQAISVAIRKQRGGNEVTLAKSVHAKVAELKAKKLIPEDYDLQVNVDFTKPTEAVVDTTMHKLGTAALVTILVCFLFLGNINAAVNILFSIPTSIIGTMMIIYFSGFTLNLFTLLALTLAISIVVDDAIMLLENIVRHYRMGKSAAQAAYDGSMEILPAATAATFAVIAVFLPVIFMSGVTGKFFFQFGVTMSAAVMLSLVEAVTITPMRAATLMASNSKISNFERWLDHRFEVFGRKYQSALKFALSRSKLVVGASLLLFAVSLVLIRHVKQEFVPAQDQNIIMLTFQTPPGTSLEATYEKGVEVERILQKNPEIKLFFTNIGGSMASGVNQASVPIALTPRETRSKNHTQIMNQIRQDLKAVKGIKVSMRDISSRGLTTGRMNPVSFNLRGSSLDVLQKKSEEIMNRLEQEGMTQDLDTDFKLGIPELLIRPDRRAMTERGVSIQSVAQTLSATVAGFRQSQFTSEGRRYDIRVKLRDEQVKSPRDIESIDVRNNYGIRVPLSQLVKLEERKTFLSISRVNRQRAIGVFGNLAPGKGQGEVLKRAEEVAREVLPDGYSFELEGASAGLSESFQSLGIALMLGLVVAYMILAVQFNSFIHPISILIALPFSMTGALLILWTFGSSLNLFSFIGLIVLMGIAKKNSILLVEFTNHVRKQSKGDALSSILEACPVRLRPILMTSVATVAAALPLVIGNSIGQETRTPMGLTIIGGSIVSTVFTLFVVPCLYLLLVPLESRKKHHTEFVTESEQKSAGATGSLPGHAMASPIMK